jgi:hypothetical protein
MRISTLRLISVTCVLISGAEPPRAAPHAGPCEPPRPIVTNVQLEDPTALSGPWMSWDPIPAAVAYNVYVGDVPVLAPGYGGQCLYAGVPGSATLLHGSPAPEAGWGFQVTGVFPEGEGPMALTPGCAPIAPPSPCTCTLPADDGPCDGACPRWFHNFATGECEPFVWGCCGGNANNFATKEDCEADCRNPCRLPPDGGPCDGVFPRWYYSVLSGHCEPFIWGGCGGNANNHPSEAACQDACGDVCSLPADPGPCDGTCPRWYFDAATGQCEPFVWGCCGGNANNFESAQACAAACID